MTVRDVDAPVFGFNCVPPSDFIRLHTEFRKRPIVLLFVAVTPPSDNSSPVGASPTHVTMRSDGRSSEFVEPESPRPLDKRTTNIKIGPNGLRVRCVNVPVEA